MAETQYANCPKCGSSNIKKMAYTWWGGMLGPNLLTHVKCQGCRTEFNGKTGQSNRQGIILYCIVTGVISLLILFVFSTRR